MTTPMFYTVYASRRTPTVVSRITWSIHPPLAPPCVDLLWTLALYTSPDLTSRFRNDATEATGTAIFEDFEVRAAWNAPRLVPISWTHTSFSIQENNTIRKTLWKRHNFLLPHSEIWWAAYRTWENRPFKSNCQKWMNIYPEVSWWYIFSWIQILPTFHTNLKQAIHEWFTQHCKVRWVSTNNDSLKCIFKIL